MPQMLCSEESIVVFGGNTTTGLCPAGYLLWSWFISFNSSDRDPFHMSYVGETCVGE